MSDVSGHLDRLADLVHRRPQLGEEHRVARGVLADGIGGQVGVDGPRERVGHDERRRRQVVHPHVGVDAPLEVPVAREHRGHGQVALPDGVADAFEQRAGVADARRAAVADEVEAERLQWLHEAGPLEVVDHDARPRRERGLDPGLRAQAPLDRLLGHQPGGDEHLGVRRVGTARDRRNDHITVGDLVVRRRCGLGGRRTRGALERDPVRVAGGAQRHAVLGAGGAGQRRLHVAQVQADVRGVHRLGSARVVPEALGLGVRLHQCEVLLVAPGEAQVVEGHLVDGEHGAGGAVLGAHVADGGPGLEGQGGDAGAVALDEGADHAVIAQQLGHRQHHVGRRDAGLRLSGDPEPDDRGQEHGERLAQHRSLRLDTAHPPAQHAEPVDHRRVRVGPHEGVAEGAPVSVAKARRDRYSRFTWWQMPMPGVQAGSHGRHPGPSATAGSAPCCASTQWRRCGRRDWSPERSTMTEWSIRARRRRAG